jgi:lipopolysaccharide transport system permease protein
MATAEQIDSRPTATVETPIVRPVTVIEPPSGWQLVNVAELWRFRELLFFLAWRDVKVRYRQTVLGAAWAVLQPAMTVLVFTVFFGRMGGMAAGVEHGDNKLAYPLFVLAGLLPWTFFTAALTSASNSVVASERLITKIYFPRLAVPFAAVGASIIDFLVGCGLLVLMMAWYGVGPSWQLLAAPLIFAIILTTAAGAGTMLSALTVNYRDFRYLIPFMVQMGMFATPTIYLRPGPNLSFAQSLLLTINPMTGLITAFRSCVLGDQAGPIPWAQVGVSAVCAAVVFVTGCLYFRKVEDGFADAI